jgi:hypothetical protein
MLQSMVQPGDLNKYLHDGVTIPRRGWIFYLPHHVHIGFMAHLSCQYRFPGES